MIMLVGNKSDMTEEERSVSVEEGRMLALVGNHAL